MARDSGGGADGPAAPPAFLYGSSEVNRTALRLYPRSGIDVLRLALVSVCGRWICLDPAVLSLIIKETNILALAK